MKKQSKYSGEFKEQALALIRKGDRTLKEISKTLGINYWTLREWKKEQLHPSSGEGSKVKISEKEELRRLRSENQDLRMENAILKKYAAILSKDQQ